MFSLRLLKWAALGGAAYYLWTQLRPRPAQAEARTRPLRSEDEEVAYDLITLEDEPLAVDVHDSGELYGMHIPQATDTALLDDDRAFEDGQNWLEALETSAAEGGALPESELNIIDDQDEGSTAATLSADRPVADFGSGGPRGL